MKISNCFFIFASIFISGQSFASPQSEIFQPCQGGAFVPGDSNPRYIIPENVKECAIGEYAKDKATGQEKFLVVSPWNGEITTSPEYDLGTLIAIEFLCPSSSQPKTYQLDSTLKLNGDDKQYNCLILKDDDQYEQKMCATCSR